MGLPMSDTAQPAVRAKIWNVPNQVTVSRLVLAVVLFALLGWGYYTAGLVVFIIAASTDAALAEISKAHPDFAVLDFNLGSETSERVAAALASAGIAFCYATGYGDAIVAQATQAPCGVLKKPYSQTDIAAILACAAASR